MRASAAARAFPCPVNRHIKMHKMRAPALIALMLGAASATAAAADNLHLLGFVTSPCADLDYCFELRVKPEYQAEAGERLRFVFNADSNIFDPENYALTLAQQNIVPGSHLRLLLEARGGSADAYYASHIWIGD